MRISTGQIQFNVAGFAMQYGDGSQRPRGLLRQGFQPGFQGFSDVEVLVQRLSHAAISSPVIIYFP